MNNGIIDIESDLIRQLSKLGGQKEQGEREREMLSAWIEGTKKTGTLNFMWCVKCSLLNYVYVMLFIKSYSKNYFQAF